MYQSIPDVFQVPVYYAEDILNKKKSESFQQYYSNSDSFNTNRKQIVIGVSLPNQRIPRWISDKSFLESYALQKGVTVKIEDADYDASLQAKQVENLISQGIDVLIIAPLDSVAASSLVEKAKSVGIKVISYDGLVYNSDIDLYISFDGTKVGELQGKYLTQNVPKGNYIIMSGDPNDDTSKLYKDGAMDYIKPFVNIGSIKIVTDKAITNWDPQNAYTIVKDSLLANDNKINAILAPNDPTAGGAIKALEEVGLAGAIAITGQEATPAAIRRIIDGTQSMTVLKDTRQLAKAAIDSAIKLANKEYLTFNATINNGKMNVPAIILTPITVNRYNIADTILNTGYLKINDIFRQ